MEFEKKSVGRPRTVSRGGSNKDTRINIKIYPEVKKALREYCRTHFIQESELVRRLIIDFLHKQGQEIKIK